MVEMWYGSILQLRPIVWAVEMKANRVLKKIRLDLSNVMKIQPIVCQNLATLKTLCFFE